MASDNVMYQLLLRESLPVAERLGSWFFYRLRDTKEIEHVIGYMLGRIEDFERRRAHACSAERKQHLGDRIAAWQRGIGLIQRIRGGDYKKLCDRLIWDFSRDPAYRHISYVSPREVEPGGRNEHRRGKLSMGARRKRKNGRPRKPPAVPLVYTPCAECDGAGFFGS